MPYFGSTPSPLVTNAGVDMNGTELILDADADTSITADSDDQIDIKIANADDFQLTANTFSVLSGSALNIDSGATIANSGTATGFGQAEHANLTDVAAITQVDGDIIMSDGTDYKAVPRRARNLVINGAMQVGQRGSTAIAAGETKYGGVDRFEITSGATAAYTITQDTSVPTGKGFLSSLKVDITTGDASLSAGEHYWVEHKIEGLDAAQLMLGSANAKTVTISFWVRSRVTGVHCVSLQNSAENRSYVFEYTIAVADTWEFFTETIDLDQTGTWLTTSGIGLRLIWSLGAGSAYHGSAGAWAAADDECTANQVNVVSSTGTFGLAGVQLELGSINTPFEHLTYAEELRACRRYYEQMDFDDSSNQSIAVVNIASVTNGAFIQQFMVEKRAAPTLGATAANTFDISHAGGDTNIDSSITLGSATKRSSRYQFNMSGSTFTAGQAGDLHRDGSDTCNFTWDAEL